LWRRDPPRVPGANDVALGPARAPDHDGARPAGHRPRQANGAGALRGPADAGQGLGRRAARGLRLIATWPDGSWAPMAERAPSLWLPRRRGAPHGGGSTALSD